MSWNPNETPFPKFLSIVVIVFACVGAPFWFLYQFHPQIFMKHELLILLSLSLCIGFPLFCINGYLGVGFMDLDMPAVDKSIVFMGGLALGGFLTIFVFYLPLILTYFRPVSSRTSITFVTVTETILIICCITILTIDSIRDEKKKLGSKRSQ